MHLSEVDTPALLIDLDAFERNLARLPTIVAEKAGNRPPPRLRPHAKTHKSPIIAHLQAAHGAIGQCCQKVGEAEVLVAGGIRDVLVTNQVVAPSKIARLAALARFARIGVCVDDLTNVAALDAACARAGTRLDVYVEVAVGLARCGVAPGPDAVPLARAIDASAHLRFMGLQAYHGTAQHLRTPDERRDAIAKAAEGARATRALIEAAGVACATITGGGTGCHDHETVADLWTELQCGSYIFMDGSYGAIRDGVGGAGLPFEHALFVWTQVMSRVAPERAILDAGHKAVAIESGMPTPVDLPGATCLRCADEHGWLALEGESRRLKLGDKLRLIPAHCDPTVNLHDWYVAVRGDLVEAVWPVAARGAVF
jgi:D-serine deaminase-like pyridoxal phosphate-dependent protein